MRTLPVDQVVIVAEPWLEQLGIGLLEADMTSGKVDVDLAALEFFGGDPQWMVHGVTFERLLQQVHIDDRQCVRNCISTLHSTSPSIIVEYRTQPTLGTTCWMLFRGRGYFDEGESLSRIAGVLIDITSLKTDTPSPVTAFSVEERLVELADLIIAARHLVDYLRLTEMRPVIDDLLLQLGMKLGAQLKSQARAAVQ